MADRSLPHIFLRDTARPEEYKPRGGGAGVDLPPRDRAGHGATIKAAFERAATEGKARRKMLDVSVRSTPRGLYFEFLSDPDFELALQPLEPASKGVEVTAVRKVGDRHAATVFVPDGAIGHFIKRFEAYLTEEDKRSGKPKNRQLVESIADVRLATLESFWTDVPRMYPGPDEAIWWEVWLRRQARQAEVPRFEGFAAEAGITLGRRPIAFPTRTVVLALSTPRQLASSIDALDDIAELQAAKAVPTDFLEAPTIEQADWARDLVARTTVAAGERPAVCLLDTGVTRAHPLIEHSLAEEDLHTHDPDWGVDDRHHHGTEMAGLALYGDLAQVLASRDAVFLEHALESVKILPNTGDNPRELYGAITAEAAARVEIEKPDRVRVFSMAVTTREPRDMGQPSSWSSKIDDLAAGTDDETGETRRLFFISAGNWQQSRSARFLDECDLDAIQDPAQAWNALTVGASTERFEIREDGDFAGWQPVAEPGELSPVSTTSCAWTSRQWPLKPDIVVEGGNMGLPPGETEADLLDDLSLLTTHHRPFEKLFVDTAGTSPATAQAARLGALIQARYPDAWPETVRALVVHSARWSPVMEKHFADANARSEIESLVRRYGFGIPDTVRALESAGNALTLVVQDVLQPFEKDKAKEMHLHELPWPQEALAELGATEVCLRVTLSYFVEPNPSRRGWKRRHRYSSHGLRFDAITPTESAKEFRRRLNVAARDEDDEDTTASDASDWFLGPKLRGKGSIHSDSWRGTAADLARRRFVGVYPVSGWWKDQHKLAAELGRGQQGARYSLVVSIETEATHVDLYTEVLNQVAVPVPIPVR